MNQFWIAVGIGALTFFSVIHGRLWLWRRHRARLVRAYDVLMAEKATFEPRTKTIRTRGELKDFEADLSDWCARANANLDAQQRHLDKFPW